jgi:hypothetical protein
LPGTLTSKGVKNKELAQKLLANQNQKDNQNHQPFQNIFKDNSQQDSLDLFQRQYQERQQTNIQNNGGISYNNSPLLSSKELLKGSSSQVNLLVLLLIIQAQNQPLYQNNIFSPSYQQVSQSLELPSKHERVFRYSYLLCLV